MYCLSFSTPGLWAIPLVDDRQEHLAEVKVAAKKVN
jgi:hypothetical protein